MTIVVMKHIPIQLFITVLSLSVLLVSCDQKFTKQQWINVDNIDPDRGVMLNDLLSNHKIIGLSYHQLNDLLGEPTKDDSLRVYYPIKIKYATLSPDPNYEKDLVIYLNKDSVVTKTKITEWEK